MNGCAMQTEKVISHILEIIYLMTGEEYMIVKKPPQYKCSPQILEERCQRRKSVLQIPADSPVHVRRCSGSNPALHDTDGTQEPQKDILGSMFQSPPGGANVQIKCDDVAVYLSVEEWEYLEHHKEEYKAMTGKNQSSPAYRPKEQETSLPHLHSEQTDFDSNAVMEETNAMDWNIAPTRSGIGACQGSSSSKKESLDKIHRQSWGSTKSRDVFTFQNNVALNHETVSEIFLETEIKEESIMEDSEDTGEPNDNHSHSLMEGHQVKTINGLDSSVEADYTLDLNPPPFSENPQNTSKVDGHPIKIVEFSDSGLLDSHTLDHVQSPFGDVRQRKSFKKGLRCSTVGQETNAIEVGDYPLKNNHDLGNSSVFQITGTGLKNQESLTDGHQAMKVDRKALENEDTENISNILRNVYENTHVKRTATYQVCSLDETTKVDINDSLVGDSEALYQPSSSFLDGPKRTCVKREMIHQEHFKNGLETSTMDEMNFPMVESHILGGDMRTCLKTELIRQEHSKNGHQTSTMDDMCSSVVESDILGGDTRPCMKTELILQENFKNRHQTSTMDDMNSAVVESDILGGDTRTCMKTELILQKNFKNGHQTSTMDEMNSPVVQNHILGVDTRPFIKTELIHQEHFKNGHQTCTKDKMNSPMVQSHIFVDDTRTCIKTDLIQQGHFKNGHPMKKMDERNSTLVESRGSILKYDMHKLAYQECLMQSQQPSTVEVNQCTPEYHNSPCSDWQSNYTHLSSSSKTSSSQSTEKVPSRRKPSKMISCGECGKVFSSNSYLSRHQRLHTGEKPFTCSECGKSFSWMSSLVTHKRTHLGEKPFSCKQCGKRFSDYSGIIKHRRSHTGEKPYSCPVCGERFAQTYQLVKHQAVHLAEDVLEKPFHGW